MKKDNQPKSKYSLKSINIHNFKGIKNASLEDIPSEIPWIFLTGQNGYGKTCLLQAIFIGLFGNREGKKLLEDKSFDIVLEGYDSSVGKFYHHVTSQSLDDKYFNKVVAYGSSRLNIQYLNSNKAEERSSQHYSLFYSDGILLNIEHELKNWYYRAASGELNETKTNELKQKYQHSIETLTRLLPSVETIKIDVDRDRVLYKEKSSSQYLTFQELASGNQSIIAMIGDMIIRLLNVQTSVTDPRDLEGIVLIDELDLHLHPIWQKKLPTLLSELFPKIQFIAATHSPIPFLGAPENSIFIKVNRNKEEGINIEKLDINIEDLTPNLILSSQIFGFLEIFPITYDNKNGIRTEDTMSEVKQNDQMVTELSIIQKDAIQKSIQQLEDGNSISHKTVMNEFKQKYNLT